MGYKKGVSVMEVGCNTVYNPMVKQGMRLALLNKTNGLLSSVLFCMSSKRIGFCVSRISFSLPRTKAGWRWAEKETDCNNI